MIYTRLHIEGVEVSGSDPRSGSHQETSFRPQHPGERSRRSPWRSGNLTKTDPWGLRLSLGMTRGNRRSQVRKMSYKKLDFSVPCQWGIFTSRSLSSADSRRGKTKVPEGPCQPIPSVSLKWTHVEGNRVWDRVRHWVVGCIWTKTNVSPLLLL